MKMLILANSSSGLYNFRQELIAELEKEHSVVAATPFSGREQELRNIGCSLIEIPIDRRGMNPVRDLKFLKNAVTLLKTEKPDLVITYTIKPNIYGGLACRLLGVPYAANITGLGTAFQKKGILRTLVTLMYKVGLKRAKTVFFENQENQQIFIESGIVGKEKTCLLNGAGVNLAHFQPTVYPEGGTTRFLFIGRVMKEKGVEELFAAMQKLRSDGIKCTLDVLGRCEENYKPIMEEYEAAGWLKYCGYQEDVRPFIAASHCFVLPSWHEGMANTNLECAAMGRPVITSNIHGCLEAVEDGVSGYLCERKNAESLYQVMKSFTALPFGVRMAMGLAGRKRMEDMFDKRKIVSKTICSLNIGE